MERETTLPLSTDTREKIDGIVAAQFDGDTAQREAAVNRALGVYEPFTNDKVNDVLKDIARVLVAQGEIEEATEANMVSYALRGLLQQYASAAERASENNSVNNIDDHQ